MTFPLGYHPFMWFVSFVRPPFNSWLVRRQANIFEFLDLSRGKPQRIRGCPCCKCWVLPSAAFLGQGNLPELHSHESCLMIHMSFHVRLALASALAFALGVSAVGERERAEEADLSEEEEGKEKPKLLQVVEAERPSTDLSVVSWVPRLNSKPLTPSPSFQNTKRGLISKTIPQHPKQRPMPPCTLPLISRTHASQTAPQSSLAKYQGIVDGLRVGSVRKLQLTASLSCVHPRT